MSPSCARATVSNPFVSNKLTFPVFEEGFVTHFRGLIHNASDDD